MRVQVYPADRHGTGHHRLVWPAEAVRRLGHELEIIHAKDRRLSMVMHGDQVVDVQLPQGRPDVMVFQRVTHKHVAEIIPLLRGKGIAVVVDIDDDLTSIHPDNPAWRALHPKQEGKVGPDGKVSQHSWRYLTEACHHATLVTCTTPALAERYARHGRVAILPNYLAPHYYGIEHEDSDTIGWPASLHSHPNDPPALGNAVNRLLRDGADIRVIGHPHGTGKAFGLSQDLLGYDAVDIYEWPKAVARFGIGIAPLADTKFNAAKSWLKPLEMSAVGVPWVASPRDDYVRLAKHGIGLLADKAGAWYSALKALRADPVLRKDMAAAGREVAESLSLDNHSWKWWDAWSHAVDLQARF